MKHFKKLIFTGAFFIVLLIAGFIFLLRGCLSEYDEYYQFDKAFDYHNTNGNVIVYLKECFKVNYYSSGQGFTEIGGEPSYYIETRDASTLKLIKSTKLERTDDSYQKPPAIIGRNADLIWLYHYGLLALNPFTHEVLCTGEKLEQLNPELKENLPDISSIKYNIVFISSSEPESAISLKS